MFLDCPFKYSGTCQVTEFHTRNTTGGKDYEEKNKSRALPRACGGVGRWCRRGYDEPGPRARDRGHRHSGRLVRSAGRG
jgi:hypothetical protein